MQYRCRHTQVHKCTCILAHAHTCTYTAHTFIYSQTYPCKSGTATQMHTDTCLGMDTYVEILTDMHTKHIHIPKCTCPPKTLKHTCMYKTHAHTFVYNTWVHNFIYMHTWMQEAGSFPHSWLVDVKLCSTEATSAGVARHPCGPCHKA